MVYTLYHLIVGICENVYPLAHIPTDKRYSVYTITVYSTVKCDGVGCIDLFMDKWYSVYTIAFYSTVKCDGVGCIIY